MTTDQLYIRQVYLGFRIGAKARVGSVAMLGPVVNVTFPIRAVLGLAIVDYGGDIADALVVEEPDEFKTS
jgi:hypothetical protein